MQKNNLKMLKKPIILSIFSFWTFSVFFTLLILIIKYSFNNQQYINSQIIGLLLIFGLIFSVFITMTVWTNQTFKSRALVFVEEYTKEIEAEKEKNIYLSRLSSLGKMAAGIAHEINNPLTVIVGKTKSIEREIQELTPDRIKIQISAEKIKGNSYRISKIVDTLKFITRDSSSEDMKKESFINIVESTYGLVQEKLEMDKIEFQLLNQCEDFQIYCHSSEISQVLLNLFSNSIEALENNKIKKINITLKSDSLNNILYFTDSGDLIKPEIANNLMTPFYTTKEVGKGSGLGLSISNSIVNKHGGVLKYETGYPTTTFSLSFPKLKSS